MFPNRFVVRDEKVMKLGAVIIADQAGALLKVLWFELHNGARGEAMRLLTARHQRLPEQAADRFPAVEPQETWTGRDAEDFFRPWSTQPLELDRELG